MTEAQAERQKEAKKGQVVAPAGNGAPKPKPMPTQAQINAQNAEFAQRADASFRSGQGVAQLLNLAVTAAIKRNAGVVEES
jgi:hypothetical protein